MIKTLILLSITSGTLSYCPQRTLILPCTCKLNINDRKDQLNCRGINDTQLTTIFENLEKNWIRREKNFGLLKLEHSSISELRANTFKDITFDEIIITNCENLTTIDENAFNGTDQVTKSLSFLHNPELTFENRTIFDILRKFTNVLRIILDNNTKITEIPSNAFSSAPMNKLMSLSFKDTFIKIGSNAFSSINYLRLIDFVQARFETIPENAFAFNSPSNLSLSLDFAFSTPVNETGINEKSLLNIKRPTRLWLNNRFCCTDYLNQTVFEPFLLDHPNNTIEMWFKDFDCNDVRNTWFRNRQFVSRVTHSNGNICPN